MVSRTIKQKTMDGICKDCVQYKNDCPMSKRGTMVLECEDYKTDTD